MDSRVGRAVRTALLVAPLSGCLSKPAVGVKEVGAEETHADLDANAMTGDEPSHAARIVLRALDLEARHAEDPETALLEMHRYAAELPFPGIRYALAELHFQLAREEESREDYLAAATYAYLFLFGEPGVEPPSPFDRRFRWACELYNRGLTEAFRDGSSFALAEGERALPAGSLSVTVDRSRFRFDPESFAVLLPADDLEPWGLWFRARDSGLGVPLVCVPEPGHAPTSAAAAYFPAQVSVPATAFLRIQGGLADIERGVPARLELVSTFDQASVALGERDVPLESDLTTPLAYTLEGSKDWGFRLRGFFRSREDEAGLQMTQPYSRGKVPVILVHGTVSSRALWAEMINFLQLDPVLRGRVQFWTYQYPSGQNIPISAAVLRETLEQVARDVDPDGDDPYLGQMVLIGHSQGGLLVKMAVVDGSPDWFERVTGIPVDELPEDTRELALRVSDFDPSPHVKRVVFMATPHRGSFLADYFFADLAAGLVDLPGDVAEAGEDLLAEDNALPEAQDQGVGTAVDNMKTNSPFLALLDQVPVADGVASHSIVAVEGDGPPEEGNDGVVAYQSAHREDVDSELVIRSGHSCQAQPRAILEVRRILLEHLAALDAE